VVQHAGEGPATAAAATVFRAGEAEVAQPGVPVSATSGALVAGLWPPIPRMDENGTGAPDGEACPAAARADVGARQRVREACFADGLRASPTV